MDDEREIGKDEVFALARKINNYKPTNPDKTEYDGSVRDDGSPPIHVLISNPQKTYTPSSIEAYIEVGDVARGGLVAHVRLGGTSHPQDAARVLDAFRRAERVYTDNQRLELGRLRKVACAKVREIISE